MTSEKSRIEVAEYFGVDRGMIGRIIKPHYDQLIDSFLNYPEEQGISAPTMSRFMDKAKEDDLKKGLI
jgi:hypothetical protein